MPPKPPMVYKSNELIEAQYKLSAAAQKIAAALISHINPNDKSELPVWNCSVAEYAKLVGISRQYAYESICQVTYELKALVIHLRVPNSRSFAKLGMFRACYYYEEDQRVEIQFEERLEEHLRDFAGNFTKYQLKQIQSLGSRYSIRLYEILRKSHPIKTTRIKTFWEITLEDLRAMLGADKKTYNRYADFRKKILDPSQKELEEKTDIKFDFEPIRRGRKIHSLKFKITHNQKFEPVKDEALEGDMEGPTNISAVSPHVILSIKGQLPDITDEQLSLIGNTYPQELILEGLFDLMRAMASDGVNGTPLNYYLGILKNKRREEQATEPKARKTTEEKLSDRSWADGLDLGEENK